MLKPSSLQIALFYAYPLSLFTGFLASHVVHFRRYDTECAVWTTTRRRARCFCAIWYLQFTVVFALLGSIIAEFLFSVSSARSFGQNGSRHDASLASYIAIALYFLGGLLPDPDGPFEPSWPNFYSWIIAMAFELMFVFAGTHAVSLEPRHIQTALCIFRTVALAVMAAFFKVAQQPVEVDLETTTEERRALLGPEISRVHVIDTGKSPTITIQEKVDAQSSGWFDYFVGFRVLFPYIWPSDSRRQQAVALVCFLILIGQRVVNILVPYQLGVLVESSGKGRLPYKEVALYILFQGLQGQQGVLGATRAILWIPISQSLYRRLSCAAFNHVLSLSLNFHLSKRIGEVMSALNKGGALNTFLEGFGYQLFPMLFDIFIAAIYFFVRFDAFYSLICLTVMWSYLFLTIYMAKYRGRVRREMARREREMEAVKTEVIASYETVHHNSAMEAEASKFETYVQGYQASEFSVLLSLNGLNIVQNSVFTLGTLFVVLLSAYQISLGTQSIAQFVSMLAYFAQLQAPLAFFGSFYNQVQNNLIDAERMLDLFKKQPEVIDRPDAEPIMSCSGKIVFKNVSFAYDKRKPVLDGITFTVAPRTSTAIVGESGSGKSTCLKLLFRFYDVSTGSIWIDDKDVRNITTRSLRENIGVVPQDIVLFNASLMYNILYAKPDATVQEVYNACDIANIHQKILTFPDGYDTQVGERGLRLSGGEKQRITIARAILKEPQILLLDEATASLDSRTENEIQNALDIATAGRTTITIAHRLSTVRKADQIIVLHEGKIVEHGKHSELLELGGRYKAMWEKQTKEEQEKRANGGM